MIVDYQDDDDDDDDDLREMVVVSHFFECIPINVMDYGDDGRTLNEMMISPFWIIRGYYVSYPEGIGGGVKFGFCRSYLSQTCKREHVQEHSGTTFFSLERYRYCALKPSSFFFAVHRCSLANIPIRKKTMKSMKRKQWFSQFLGQPTGWVVL